MSQVIRPVIPYRDSIHEGIHEGKQIKIAGCVPLGADRFTVTLMNGIDTENDECPLHISVRFKINTVIRKIYHNNSWDAKERNGCFPFTIGEDFTIIILVERAAYQISVNSQHCWSFSHRLPFTRARSILINGDVSVEQIEFINKSTPQEICPPIPTVDNDDKPSDYDIPLCIFPIHGGIRPGMSIYIAGRSTSYPYRFTISIQNGVSTSLLPDVALQLDVRFYNYSVIRNSRVNEAWSFEETMISHFPFYPERDFEIEIKIHCDMFVIRVNCQDFVTFRHRLHVSPQFDVLSIQNDIIVTSIKCT